MMWKLTLALMLIATPAWAVCPAHSNAIAATVGGGFRMCPSETDADGVAVPSTGYYASCQVTATWGGSQTASVTVSTPTPGTAVVVNFPAARGIGSATGTCTSTPANGGLTGAVASSAITFRPIAAPASPVLSQ